MEGRPSCVKVKKSLVYSSTAFEDVKTDAVSRAKEKRARDEGLFKVFYEYKMQSTLKIVLFFYDPLRKGKNVVY